MNGIKQPEKRRKDLIILVALKFHPIEPSKTVDNHTPETGSRSKNWLLDTSGKFL
jgi:hypothetical protein